MKKAFTMIELIFVIMILGIISAIAVPKLTATRDDAKIVALKANIITVFKDIKTHYAATGEYNWKDLPKITNVPVYEYGASYELIEEKHCIGFGGGNEWLRIFSFTKISENCKKVLTDPELKSLLTDKNGTFLLDDTSTSWWIAISKNLEDEF